jgi:aerobic C4-dicarboxylate transport protein
MPSPPFPAHAPHPVRPWYRQLWVQVFVAMAAGALLGWWHPAWGVLLQPLGDAFIRAIRMLIAPLIFCTVVTGIAQLRDRARVGRLALKSLIYFELLTTAALIVGLVMVNWLRPGAGMHLDVAHLAPGALDAVVKPAGGTGVIPFLTNIIPGTLAGAFAEGNILQVLFVSILTGFALAGLGPAGAAVLRGIETLSDVVFAGVDLVMWAAPLGAFGALAFTVGKFGVGALASLGRLVGDFYLTCLIFVFGLLGGVALLGGFSLLRLMRYLREEILICIATTSSEVVLPRLIVKMKAAGCDPGVVDLVVPCGYSFNLDGTCLYLATATVFLAQATDTPLGLAEQVGLLLILLVTSKGAAGVAGAAFIVLTATLSAQQTIPVASVALILGIHRLMSQGLTPTNFIGNAVATIVVSKWEKALDTAKLAEALDRRAIAPVGQAQIDSR